MIIEQPEATGSTNGDSRKLRSGLIAAATAGAAALVYGVSQLERHGRPSTSRPPWMTAVQADHSQCAPVITTPTAQVAVSTCLAGPLVHLLYGYSPAQPQLTTQVNEVAAQVNKLQPWELASALWGFATLGVSQSSDGLQSLAQHAVASLPHLPLYESIIAAWSLYILQLAPEGLWDQMMSRLKGIEPHDLDEACVLYLLHACMQQASLLASKHQQNGPSTPRASKEEVEALTAPLPRKVKKKLLAAYQVRGALLQLVAEFQT